MELDEQTILEFVRGSLKSAWSLELLLLLRRVPIQAWNVDGLVRELRGSVSSVTESLEALNSAGLIEITEAGEYRYSARTPALEAMVAGLVELYSHKPITVLRAIFSSPTDKIRSFSDAFLIKKK